MEEGIARGRAERSSNKQLQQDGATLQDKGAASQLSVASSLSLSKPPEAQADDQLANRREKMLRWSIVAFLGLAALVTAIATPLELAARAGTSNSKRPNIVFILTDDQDAQMDSLSYMPVLKELLLDQGTQYTRHYCTVALCCPSRVSLWTGRAAHNTNVTDLAPPYGGYPRFGNLGLNKAWLPVYMQEAGYNTYYTGKLMNSHNTANYDTPLLWPDSFNATHFLLEPGTYSYWNPVFQSNNTAPKPYTNRYNTDVVTNHTLELLDLAVGAGGPFMLTVAPIAPHTDVEFLPGGGLSVTPPKPKPIYNTTYPNVTVPRTPNFNPDVPSGSSWIYNLPQQSADNVAWNDEFYKVRIAALQSIDDLLNQTISALESYGILDNTYIFYSSDNGYHIGQHRLQPGKSCGYETDINVPLIVRGPGVPKGLTTSIVSSHTDLAPTFLGLAGQPPRPEFDGSAIPLTLLGIARQTLTLSDEHVNVEFWGNAPTEGIYGVAKYLNNTYKAVRMIGKLYSIYYAVWCSGQHELYDMVADPYQMKNLYANSTTLSPHATIAGFPAAKVQQRLDTLLMVLKSCKAESCQTPWKSLHPTGAVSNLFEALEPQYDSFYSAQSRVGWTECDAGYIVAAEGPQEFNVFGTLNPRWSELA